MYDCVLQFWGRIWKEVVLTYIKIFSNIYFCLSRNPTKCWVTGRFLCFADRASQYNLSNWPTKWTNSCFVISLLYASTCFEDYVLIIRRSKLYYTASGIVILCRWPSSARVERDSFLNPCTGRPPTVCDVTICCKYNFDLLIMSTYCSKHVEAYNKLIRRQEFLHEVG